VNLHPLEKDVAELDDRHRSGSAPRLVDVREPVEYAWCRLPGAELVPLDRLPEMAEMWDAGEEILLYCHTGVRSLAAADWLRARGFSRAYSLAGGIHRWSLLVDPSVPTY